MKHKILLATSACGVATVGSHASTRLANPFWDESVGAVNFDWIVFDANGQTGWVETGGYIEGVENYVDVEDEGCSCPEYTQPPCYKVPDVNSASWNPW